MAINNTHSVERMLTKTQPKRTKPVKNRVMTRKCEQSMTAVKRLFNPMNGGNANCGALQYTYLSDTNITVPTWMEVMATIQMSKPTGVIAIVRWTGVKTRLRKHQLSHRGIIPHVRVMGWRALCDLVMATVKRDPMCVVSLPCKTPVVKVEPVKVVQPVATVEVPIYPVDVPLLHSLDLSDEPILEYAESVELSDSEENPFDALINRIKWLDKLTQDEAEIIQDCVDIIKSHVNTTTVDEPLIEIIPIVEEPCESETKLCESETKPSEVTPIIDTVVIADSLLIPQCVRVVVEVHVSAKTVDNIASAAVRTSSNTTNPTSLIRCHGTCYKRFYKICARTRRMRWICLYIFIVIWLTVPFDRGKG